MAKVAANAANITINSIVLEDDDVAVRREPAGFAVTAVDLEGDQRLVRADDPSKAIFELARQVGITFPGR